MCLKEQGFIYSFHPLVNNKVVIQFKKYFYSYSYMPWTLLELGGLQQKEQAKAASLLIKEGEWISSPWVRDTCSKTAKQVSLCTADFCFFSGSPFFVYLLGLLLLHQFIN